MYDGRLKIFRNKRISCTSRHAEAMVSDYIGLAICLCGLMLLYLCHGSLAFIEGNVGKM